MTPELQGGITDELSALDLGGVPFRFDEASERGRNYFDMALDAPRPANKARVLSEGEQRALGIACFFAEMKRVPGTHGIIVDDPVSSLDHQRLRKVAQRLVLEAAAGRQVIIFTHHLVFYQEVIAAAAANAPQVPVLVNLISKRDGHFGLISENDEPWIAKKVVKRIEALRARLNSINAISPECGINSTSFLVAYLIADHFNRVAGFAWPSLARLGEMICLSNKSVHRAVRQLEREGGNPWIGETVYSYLDEQGVLGR